MYHFALHIYRTLRILYRFCYILGSYFGFWNWFISFRSADNSIRMFDRRSLTSGGVGIPVHTFEDHTAAVLCVQVLQHFMFLFFFSLFGWVVLWSFGFSGVTKEFIRYSGHQTSHLSLEVLQKMASWTFGTMKRYAYYF